MDTLYTWPYVPLPTTSIKANVPAGSCNKKQLFVHFTTRNVKVTLFQYSKLQLYNLKLDSYS